MILKIYKHNKRRKKWLPLKAQYLQIGRLDRIGSAIQIVQVDRNAESDPFLEKDPDQKHDPKKPDRSEA
jgi:hypothetical protein